MLNTVYPVLISNVEYHSLERKKNRYENDLYFVESELTNKSIQKHSKWQKANYTIHISDNWCFFIPLIVALTVCICDAVYVDIIYACVYKDD